MQYILTISLSMSFLELPLALFPVLLLLLFPAQCYGSSVPEKYAETYISYKLFGPLAQAYY